MVAEVAVAIQRREAEALVPKQQALLRQLAEAKAASALAVAECLAAEA